MQFSTLHPQNQNRNALFNLESQSFTTVNGTIPVWALFTNYWSQLKGDGIEIAIKYLFTFDLCFIFTWRITAPFCLSFSLPLINAVSGAE